MEIIKLAYHNENWKNEFHEEKNLISDTLEDIAYAVHHVGSTAVADLMAKPIIDIAVESSTYPPPSELIAKLETIGYAYKGDGGVSGRSWFIKGTPRKFNLHLCFVGSDIVMKQIMFRNQLINHVSLRRAYEKIKIKNSLGRDVDSAEYASSKSNLINSVLLSISPDM